MTNNRRKFIAGGVAVALAGVLTIGGIATRMNNVEVQASPSLDGIEEIIGRNSAQTPFTILEIVPSSTVTVSEQGVNGGQFKLSTGTLGWLISGNEPMRPELTLQQIQDSNKRKEFVNTKLKNMLTATRLVEGTSGPLTWQDYDEITAEAWELLPDDQKREYDTFLTDGAQLVSNISMTPATGTGDYVMRYLNPDATGSENSIAEDFFNKGDNTKLIKTPDAYFDPNFILDSRSEAGTGLYFVEFAPADTVKRGAFRATQEKEYNIHTGEDWDLSIAENTLLYEKDANGRYQIKGYVYKSADGKVSINAAPISVSINTVADGTDVIFKNMKRYAAENPAEPEYGEEEPAGEPGTPSENTTVSEGEAPGDPTEPEDPETPADPGEEPVQPGNEEPAGEDLTLYSVVFEYTEDIVDSETLYYISDYKKMADDTDPGMRGLPYKVMTSEPLVSNYFGKGSINLAPGVPMNSPWICFEKTEMGNFRYGTGTGSYYLKGTKIFYKGGFRNNDWFKKWVFDLDRDTEDQEARDNMSIQVYTVSAASVTVSDVEKADLIYLSPGNRGLVANGGFMPEYPGLTVPGYSETLDISKDVTNALLYQASMRNKPVMTDYELVKNESTTVRASYAWKASFVLAAADLKAAYNRFVSSYSTDGIIQMTDKDHTWVNRNVYIFNDFVEPNLGHTILNYNFIEDLMNKSYIDDGLKDVKQKIDDTNASRSQASRKIKNTKVDEATIIRHILNYGRVETMAVKSNIHILELEPTNMGLSGTDDHWGTKNVNLQYDLSVDEKEKGNAVESTILYCKHDLFADSVNTNRHVKETLNIKPTESKIKLTQMGTQEFVGKIDDLNSTYDMIFIGDDSTGLNHRRDNDATSGTKFNDATMNGLVYFNVGDYQYEDDDRLMGSLESEYWRNPLSHNWDDVYKARDYRAEQGNDDDTTIGRTRFSGNDIRKSDIDYFYNFARAGYPIVFADNLINENTSGKRTVNEDYVDNTSHMCEMIEKLLNDKGTEDNVFRISDLQDDTEAATARRKRFEDALGLLRPEIVFLSPEIKSGDKAEVSRGSSIDGSDKNFIDVKFRIDDPGSSSDYVAKAFLDLNADGKYAKSEEIGGGAIRIYDSGSSAAVDRESLHSGTEYRIVCELNDAPVGVYPWKLMVAQKGNEYRRDGKLAYFLAPTGRRDVINVLQLKSGEHGGRSEYQSLDLEAKLNDPNSILGKYLREARDFDLRITAECSDYVFNRSSSKVRVEDADSNGVIDEKDYLALFDQYDMLIIGFGDWFKWGSSDSRSNEAAKALLQYIALGKSVLFCHDATSMYNYDSKWGYALNQYIRSIVGMNRYGVKTMAETFADNGTLPALKDLLGKQAKDDIWVPRSRDANGNKKTLRETQSQGWTYHNMVRFQNTGSWKWNDEDKRNYDADGKNKPLKFSRIASTAQSDYTTTTIGKTTKVNILNRGQITEYPYSLPDEMPVKVTHAQYYQLNLDIDDDEDGETDVVVWYTLGKTDSGGTGTNRITLYSVAGRDGRNNYFIYNKGNVVYSGQGHWNFDTDNYDRMSNTDINTNSTYESQLIVNTIIAAYAAGTRAAKVHFHENGNYTSRSITSDILPFDAVNDDDTLAWERDTAPMSASTNIPGVHEGATKTTYFEIDDTNVVETKKIYAKFYKEDNAGLANNHARTEPGTLNVKEVVALTDEGEDVSASYGAITPDANGEFLLYDSTNDAHKNAPNAGKMYKLVYYLDSFDVDASNMATVTNTPGIRVVMREAVQKRKNGTVATSYSDDVLPLIRTRMFDLK